MQQEPQIHSLASWSLPGPTPPSPSVDLAREQLRAEEEAARQEAGPPVRRLFLAGIGILFGGIVFFVILPYFRVYLPPLVPAIAFAAILFGAIASSRGERALFEDESDRELLQRPEPEGCPIGCCPGPRPMRMLRGPSR